MKTAPIQAVRKTIRACFPRYVVSMKAGTFDYLHHDSTVFERRSLPCLHVSVTSKEYHLDRSDRRIYHHPDCDAVVSALRSAGLCAEHHVEHGVSVISAEPWPINTALGLGSWRGQPQ